MKTLKDYLLINEAAVVEAWNGGVPTVVSTHDAIRDAGDEFTKSIWADLSRRQGGTPAWMLDVPRIADWAAQVEDALAKHGHSTKS